MNDSSKDIHTRLPLGVSPRTHRRIVIAHHLILTGYGHWLPNDPRGSGSQVLKQDKLADLGPVHHGRKHIQPPRCDVRSFYQKAEDRLEFERLWFDDPRRAFIARTIERVVIARRYTVWACAILSNHMHLCIRRHRDGGQTICKVLMAEIRQEASSSKLFPPGHPVWSQDIYVRYLYTPDEVRQRIEYITGNPSKEHLAPQDWSFVVPYDGWPARAE